MHNRIADLDDIATKLSMEDGWSVIPHELVGVQGQSFVRRDGTPDRLRVRYYKRELDGQLVGKIWFGAACQGPPGHAHGGSIAAILDDSMGVGAWLQGHAVLAAEIRVRFLKVIPLEQIVYITTQLSAVDGKRITMTGTLHAIDGTPFAQGEGLFIRIGVERFVALQTDRTPS